MSQQDRPMALSGVRVLDFTRLGFGAQATLILGCLGADVVKVETSKHPDAIRVMPPFAPVGEEDSEAFGNASLARVSSAPSLNRGGIFFKYNTGGKRSIAVDARHPEGIALLKRLVAASDVVTESFAPGTLERWGLTYDVMREQRPDIVYVSMSGFGHAGPDSHYVTMGPTAQALTGLTFLVGLPDRPPAGWSFSYLDHVGGYLGAVGVLTGLAHRDRTGEGQHVDVSQLEPGVGLVGDLLLDFQVNGRRGRRPGFPPGNRSLYPELAPQGAYRAAGDDRWVVISCRTDEQWQSLVAAMGSPARASDARYATRAGRVAARSEIDGLVEEWTSQRDRYDVMHALQAVGVPAGAVQDARDRMETDEQLRARRHFTHVRHSEVGELPLEGVPFRMSATPPDTGGRIRRGPPCLGEDTDAVLDEWLGMEPSEVAALRADAVLS